MVRRVATSTLLALAVITTFLAGSVPLARAQTGERCFAETGFCISGRIREFWESNGGLAVFGLPLGPQQEITVQGGGTVQAQWFERHRLELHPENPAPYDVLLGRLGADRLAQLGRPWQGGQSDGAGSGDAERCRLFAETGQTVCDEFLAAWRRYGLSFPGVRGVSFEESLALFGLPLSAPQTETIDGKEYTVQWFERARFELHPENQPPYTVLFGRLGAELGGDAATPANPGSSSATALQRGEWTLVSFGATSAPEQAGSERPGTIAFDGARVAGFTGCNRFGGPYQASGDTITFGALMTTRAACAGEALTRQERGVLAVLQGAARYSISGDTLRITSADGAQELTYRAAAAGGGTNTALQSGEWRLVSFSSANTSESAGTERPSTLTFAADQVSGNSGCNGFGGSYQATGDTISFGPIIGTLMACTSEALQRQERTIYSVLQNTARYNIAGDTLRITSADGTQELTYRAAQMAKVTGTVTYRQRSALPPQAQIEVKLVDVSRADAPATVIASQTIQANGNQVPFAFELAYDPAQIDQRYSYAVQVRITVDGELKFVTTERYSVITQGNPTTVDVVVQPV